MRKFLSQLPKYLKGVSVISGWSYNDYDEDNTQIDTMPYPIYAIKGSTERKMICDIAGFRSDVAGRLYAFNDSPAIAGQNGPITLTDKKSLTGTGWTFSYLYLLLTGL